MPTPNNYGRTSNFATSREPIALGELMDELAAELERSSEQARK